MSYVDIPLPRLAIALSLIVVAIVLSRRASLGLERDLAWGSVRAAAQLVAIGYVLLLLFDHEHPAWVFLVLTVMILVAAFTSARRVEKGPGARILFPRALASIVAASAVALVPVFLFVVPPHPWFEAR